MNVGEIYLIGIAVVLVIGSVMTGIFWREMKIRHQEHTLIQGVFLAAFTWPLVIVVGVGIAVGRFISWVTSP